MACAFASSLAFSILEAAELNACPLDDDLVFLLLLVGWLVHWLVVSWLIRCGVFDWLVNRMVGGICGLVTWPVGWLVWLLSYEAVV